VSASGIAASRETRRIAAQSGSSFYWPMRLLPRGRREAMFAIYAFCRAVDDIADGDLPPKDKAGALAGWRGEIARVVEGRPQTAIGLSLLHARSGYGLDHADLEAVIDGVAMDVSGESQAPDMATLTLYCRRVAGAVGLLSIKVFGDDSPAARQGAVALGHAMQLTNILRDIGEDAVRGRLYLPRDLLVKHGIAVTDAAAVVARPAVAAVCAELGEIAARRFADAEAAFAGCDRKALRPAFAMMDVYRKLLQRMARGGWTRLDRRPRIGAAAKLWIALKHLLP
jgi:phytoene synthase